MPGSHKAGVIQHCVSALTKEVHLPSSSVHPFRPGADKKAYQEGEVKGLSIPMKRGDVLFVKSRTIHSSCSNTSDHIRFSVDVRYHLAGQSSGRETLPSFVARSNQNPNSEMRDHK
jgi:ectoine hydroxylase-related dioxygenase (phytanoyl-CoA dioxygenase family)